MRKKDGMNRDAGRPGKFFPIKVLRCICSFLTRYLVDKNISHRVRPEDYKGIFPSMRILVFSTIFIFQLTVSPAEAATHTVANTADAGADSLREAISIALPGDIIDFDPAVTLITLSSGELLIDKALTIDGGGNVTIDAGGTSRIFNLDDGIASQVNISLSGLVLTGGSASNGGAIYNKENLVLTNSTVTGNTASSHGGGIYNFSSSSCAISTSTIGFNSASSYGGGIYNTSASCSISSSTLAGNTAFRAGACYNTSSTLNVSNSTISSNSVSENGGAIFSEHSPINISNSTIASNAASATSAAVMNRYSASVCTLVSSVIANNYPADIRNIDSATATADYSLIEDPTGHAITDGGTNIVGQDPMLGPLKNYGGSTETHVLLTGSPAIDAGSNPDSLLLDQRGTGYPRIADSGIDMGAVEGTHTGNFGTLTVDNTGDTVDGDYSANNFTLREAISIAQPGDTIAFDGGVFPNPASGTITLTSGELLIDKALIIDGGGNVTIDGNCTFRVFNLDDGIASLVDISLTGLVLTGGSAVNGGGIFNKENLVLTDTSVTGSTASSHGGGIYNDNSATCSIDNSLISGNSAAYGGGVYNNSNSSCAISTSTIGSNSASSYGGGIYNTSASCSISSSTLAGNSAFRAGACYNTSSTLNVSNSTISSNSASENGGAIFSEHSPINISNSTIASNAASATSAAVMNRYSASVCTLVSSVIANNYPADIRNIDSATATADYSLIEDPTGHAITDGGTNIVGQDPMLGPLKNYGGSTETHVLLTGSPAIDAGSDPDALLFDQRGLPRLDGSNIDMGAVEGTHTGNFATVTVDNIGDTVDGDYTAGNLTLREAISLALPGDTIDFDPAVTLITLTSGELLIDRALTIDGGGNVTIDAGGASRIFDLDDGIASLVDITLTGLTLTGGSALNGGAILNKENLILTDTAVTGNTSSGNGGGIYNDASATCSIDNSLISGNSAAYGGGVYNNSNSSCTISTTTIDGNSATNSGGGIYTNSTASCSTTTSVISTNTATWYGGGIYNNTSSACTIDTTTIAGNTATYGAGLANYGTLTVNASTVSGNTSSSTAGGMWIYRQTTTTISNTTVSGNTSTSGNGGGILVTDAATLNLYNSTVAYNSALNAGGVSVAGSTNWGNSTLNLSSTIIASNSGTSGPDLSINSRVTLTADHNLVATADGHTITDGDVDGNIVGQEAMLDILRDNGGPTQTHMLLAASPAIGAGSNPLLLSTDQRGTGFPREVGTIDMGALETDTGLVSGTWVVDSTDDIEDGDYSTGNLTLREAIDNSLGNAVINFDQAVFDPGAPATITLGSQLVINKPLTINGAGGVILDGNNASRIFYINDQTSTASAVALNDLVLTNGSATDGGAVWNAENLVMPSAVFTGNTATGNGGAIYNSPDSATVASALVTLTDALVDANTAVNGGGVYNGKNITFSSAGLSGNSATYGGGIYNNTSSACTIDTTTIAGNSATYGAGLANYGTLTVNASTVSGNTASSTAGGMWIYRQTTTTISNTTVSGNTSTSGNGGGIMVTDAATLNLYNSTVAYNSALNAGGVSVAGSTNWGYSNLNISSTIIASNSGTSGPDLSINSRVTTAADHSLIATANGHTITDGDVDGNIVGSEPLLFPLADYGGPTATHTLQDGSPCIASGSNPLVLATDQRGTGFPREVGTIDMGAVEYMTNTMLTVSKTGSGTGTVTSSPAGIDCGAACSDTFDPNGTVTLTATPGLETVFAGWSAPCAGTGNCSVSMDQARSVTATFTLNQYSLDVTVDGTGSGSVASSPAGIDCGLDCSQAYDYNTPVTLTATPATGSTFTGWSGECTGTGPCNVTMDQARSATSTFTLNQYTVTADADGNGSGTVTSDAGGINYAYQADNTATSTALDHGSSITVTATADTGSTVSWTGCAATSGTPTAATCTFSSLDGNQTVTATFTRNQYTVRADAAGNGYGTVLSDVGGISYTYQSANTATSTALDHGSSITITANADTGSTVSWSGCAATEGTPTTATCTFSSLEGSQNVTATFTQDTFILDVQLEGTGTGTVTSSPAGIDCGADCFQLYDGGTVVTLTAAPGEKSRFKGWTGACTGSELTCEIMVDQAVSVGADFESGFPWNLFLPTIIGHNTK